MSEEKFQEFLQRELRDYNAPPASTPRDEMWSVIAEARAKRRPAGGVAPLAPRRPILRYAPWVGMAATLLIGIGIGRYVIATQSPTALAQADSLPATTPTTLVSSETDTANDSSRSLDAPQAQRQTTPRDATPVTRYVAAQPDSRLPAATPAEANTTAFTLASREHLSRAEALVSVVAATPVDATMDSLTGRWAREMLVNTRLLLDSPAGDDPLRRRLLEDLETVLVQLIQRSGADDEDREILDRTLERTQLLTRLRTGAAGI